MKGILVVKSEDLKVNKILLPYLGIMVAMCTVLQIIIAVRANGIDLLAGILTAVIALYYGYSQIVNRKKLNNIRFGRLIHHIIAFVTVNLSFHIHAAILAIVSTTNTHKFEVALLPEWYGVIFGMFVFWGLGLLIHMTASVAMRGYEELKT